MRLISCHIENFGKLHNINISFDSELHVICEDNGWGKSTLASFIKAMFYGLSGDRRRSIEESERKRYAPWQGGPFGGWLVFETGGRRYRAARIFGDKESNDTFELRDDVTNLICDDYSPRLGEQIFGINADSFARTVFITQGNLMTETNADIDAKIGNLTGNEGDMDGYDKALDALSKAVSSLTPDRATGSLAKRKQAITSLERTINEGQNIARDMQENEKLAESLKCRLKELKEKQTALMQRQVEAAGDYRLWCTRQVIAGAAVIFAGIVAVLLSRFFEEKISMAMIFCGVAALAAGLFIVVSTRARKSCDDSLKEFGEVTDDIESTQRAIMTCEDRAVRLRASYDKWQEEKERHYMLCGQQELEQKKYERLKKTKEMLNEAKEAMTARYAEPVKKSFLRHYSEMAANSVPQFHLDANAAVTVDECGMQRKAALLSQGSRDLIGISLRVALIDAMYTGEKPMILMDDPFACLDDGKLEGALEWLGTLSKEYQIIYFTCSRYRCI